MKIKISPTESYNLDLPEEMDSGEFSAFVDRLLRIQRVLVKDIFAENVTGKKAKGDYTPLHSLTREQVIEVFRIYYGPSLPKEKREMIENKFNVSYSNLTVNGAQIKRKYSILPQEVGLRRFPTKGEDYRQFVIQNQNGSNTSK